MNKDSNEIVELDGKKFKVPQNHKQLMIEIIQLTAGQTTGDEVLKLYFESLKEQVESKTTKTSKSVKESIMDLIKRSVDDFSEDKTTKRLFVLKFKEDLDRLWPLD